MCYMALDQCCTVLYCTALYCSVLHYTALHCPWVVPLISPSGPICCCCDAVPDAVAVGVLQVGQGRICPCGCGWHHRALELAFSQYHQPRQCCCHVWECHSSEGGRLSKLLALTELVVLSAALARLFLVGSLHTSCIVLSAP
jgi:hypothetical protein